MSLFSDSQPERGIKFSAGFFGDHVHGSADCVSPEERSLRASQYLNTFYINQIKRVANHTPGKHTVQINPYGGVFNNDKIRLTHTSDIHRGRLDTAGGLGIFEMYIGCDLADSINACGSASIQLFRRQYRHRCGHVLKTLFTFTCGDDNLFKHLCAFSQGNSRNCSHKYYAG